MILLLTSPRDSHVDHVASRLRQRGASYIRFDPACFPSAAEASISISAAGKTSYKLKVGDEHIDLGDVVAAWYRRPGRPAAHPAVSDTDVRRFIDEECKSFFSDVWASLDCLWLPALPAGVRQAGLKLTQLKVAGELGFELPPTLVTNSPRELLEFYRQHDGRIISKLIGTAFSSTLGNTFVRYTEAVRPRDIAHAEDLRHCPVIFQAYVPKRIELRITVVGTRVFAAEIHSQATHHTRLDWRRYDDQQTPYMPHDLPRELQHSCTQLVARLGLHYGAIDMVLTPDDRYVFLEINPNGQYLWIEHETGLPITEAICDLLITGTREPAMLQGAR